MRGLEKPVEHAAFAAVRNPDDASVLLVERPESDDELGGMWGLPARPIGTTEGVAEAVRRVGTDKLGVELDVGDFLGRGVIDREAYLLHGELYEATLASGTPTVPQSDTDAPGTQYVEWRWVSDDEVADEIREIARHGSLCTNLYLDHLGEQAFLDG